MLKRFLLAMLVFSLVWLAGCAHNDPYYISDEEMIKDIEAYNAKVKDQNDKVICKRIRPTGTLFFKTVCRTKRDWDLQKHGAQEMMQKPKAGMPKS